MFESEFSHLIKNSLIYGVGQVLNRFISFLLLPVFTAYLSPNDYGVIAILGVMNLVVTALFSLGFGAATGICYFEGNSQTRKEETIWTSTVLLAVSFAILAAVAFLFPYQISESIFKTPAHADLVKMSLLSNGMILLSTQFMLYLMFEKRAGLYVKISTAVTLCSLGMSVVTVVFLGRGVSGMIESILAASTLGLFLSALPIVRGLKFRFNRTVAGRLLQYGIPLIPSSLCLFILQQANQYILQFYRGLEEVGVYIIGFNFGLVMNLFVSAFSNTWYPYFMSYMERQGEARELFSKIITYYIIGFGAVSMLFYAAAKPVVMVMTQAPFHDAYKIVGAAATSYYLVGLFMLLLPGIYFAKEVKFISLIYAIAALTSVLFNMVLVPLIGMVGASLALVLSHITLVTFQLTWNYYRRDLYLGISYEQGRILRFAVVYLGFAAIALWPRNMNLHYEMTISALLSTGIAVALFKMLTKKEKLYISSMMSRLKVLGLSVIEMR